MKTHPHAEATYRVVSLADGGFGVEVTIPDSHPTTVSRFATDEDAQAWIADHRHRIENQSQSGRWFRGSAGSAQRRSTGSGTR